jgi:hypothetical protein
MALHVYIPTQFVSRYSLLGVFARELAEAFASAGAVVNAAVHPADQRGVFVLFNTPERTENIKAWVQSTVGDLRDAAVLHYHVDHPLALHAPHMDEFVTWPTYRLLMPCRDDGHLLRLRWPTLKHLNCGHGIAPASLCSDASLEEEHAQEQGEGPRRIPLVLAGTIHGRAELAQMRGALPEGLREIADAAAGLMAVSPQMPFSQAFDLSLPGGVFANDHWKLMEAVWRYATAHANATRRVMMARAMQGVPALVVGPAAWEEHCVGTLRYGGELPYENLPALLRQARVTLAWGPTQFAHTYSERLLLSMGAGCATVTDDRLTTRVQFVQDERQPACLIADVSEPERVREAVDALLESPDLAAAVACRGRAVVEAGHLWGHRLNAFAAAATDCWKA